MITNNGKRILGKYLIGQAPAYASYIAVGCGAQPLATDDALDDYSNKQNLDFEMFRVPIESRGYVVENENGVDISKIVFTAELPTAERYEITEIALYSAGSNPSAATYDSRTILSFSNSEVWKYHSATTNVTDIPEILYPLDSGYFKIATGLGNQTFVTFTTTTNHSMQVGDIVSISKLSSTSNQTEIIQATISAVPTSSSFVVASTLTGPSVPTGYASIDDNNNVIRSAEPAIRTSVSNRLFSNTDRIARYENCRFLNSTILLNGNLSDITYDPLTGDVGFNSLNDDATNHIHLDGVDLDLSKNAPTDELRLALSVINRDGEATNSNPKEVRLVLEFGSSEDPDIESAQLQVVLSDTDYEFDSNRYIVVRKQLQDLVKQPGFSWNLVKVIKVYATVINQDDEVSDQFLVALDALRLENINTANPLYGMTGYSVIKTANASTIKKLENTSNSIEFRLAIGIE